METVAGPENPLCEATSRMSEMLDSFVERFHQEGSVVLAQNHPARISIYLQHDKARSTLLRRVPQRESDPEPARLPNAENDSREFIQSPPKSARGG